MFKKAICWALALFAVGMLFAGHGVFWVVIAWYVFDHAVEEKA